jgi:DNA-3-methyladenine glycosylase I
MKKEKRCSWCLSHPLYVQYHDEEWGVPVYDDQKLFEFLILEGAQAGLSWFTILKRRDGYRKAYKNFDVKKVARFTEKEIQKLILNENIIRNQAKIRSSVNNAKLFIEIQKEFGSFSEYSWQFVGGKPINNKRRSLKEIQPTSKESDAFSADLKKRGFKFTGSTIIYAHMQATGMVNDHLISCPSYKKCLKK